MMNGAVPRQLKSMAGRRAPKGGGFTLIELMITVAVIGILAAIAYPSYMESVAKSRRSNAEGALAGFANAMERHYTETGAYTGAASGGGNTGSPASSVYPSQSPLDGSTKYYNLTISAATATMRPLRMVSGRAEESKLSPASRGVP